MTHASSEVFSQRLSAKRRWYYFDIKAQDDGTRGIEATIVEEM